MSGRRLSPGALAALATIASLLLPTTVPGQGAPAAGFAAGGQQVALLDFSTHPLGRPTGIRVLEGNLEVVDFQGMRMLKASSRSTFLLQLPAALPKDFTLEFELIPKTCCNPEDLAFEGTPAINQSDVSANVLWHRDHQRIVGGGAYYDRPMPPELTAAVPGALTTISVSVQDKTMRMFTNGQLLYQQDRNFVRGRVLRVFLGGQNDAEQAVYLAKLRVATGAPTNVASGSPPGGGPTPSTAPPGLGRPPSTQAPPTTQGPTVSTSTSPTVSPPLAASAGPVNNLFTVNVTLGTNGPVVTWNTVPQATGYVATRSKIDDLNCCNTASGARTYAATSPWQDSPLPMSGTYLYRVTANTPTGLVVAETQFGFRLPGGTTAPAPAPLTPVLVQPTTTATASPQPAPSTTLTPRPSSTPTAMNTGPAPTNLRTSGSVTFVDVSWDAVPGADRYAVSRSIAGSSTSTPVEGVATWTQVRDVLTDYRVTYTYRVVAYQPDGTYGEASVDYVPPAPTDPANFRATVVGPGEVRFDWDLVIPSVDGYLLAGPGAGNGMIVGGHRISTFTLKGIPVGTHTWTIASNYAQVGVLTPHTAWPRTTATVNGPDPAPRYRLVALGVRADRQSKDINDARDGNGDEVYFTAIVNRTTLTGLPLPVVKEANLTQLMTKSHGDEAVSVPYGRIRAGTASATGGIRTGDVLPPTLDLTGTTPALQGNTFPMLLWEGDLENNAAVVIHPALWEDDVNPQVQAIWARLIIEEAANSYSPGPGVVDNSAYAVEERTYTTYKEIFTYSGGGTEARPRIFDDNSRSDGTPASILFQCTTIMVNLIGRRPCEAHHVDRPIGLRGYGNSNPGYWFDPVVVLTKAGVEASLLTLEQPRNSPEPLGPGTFIVWLYDNGVGDYAVTEAVAQYKLYLRLERVP